MLNIVIPLAGRGSRFAEKGYKLPKPLISVHGKPMISVVINNVRPSAPHRFIFICLNQHEQDHSVVAQLKKIEPSSEIVLIDQVTEGAACTVLLAKKHINNDDPLMIANSDQWINYSIDEYLKRMRDAGHIMTMVSSDPKWSFVRLNDIRDVIEVVEKKPVSTEATVGIYNFKHGRLFVDAAEKMIRSNKRVNNEFYVAPAYNEMIAAGLKVGFFNIGDVGESMFGLGIPEDLEAFLKNPLSKKATNFA